MPERPLERLLTVDEVAELLRLSRGSVYHMVSQGRLPCIRLSKRCLRFSREAIAQMLSEMTQEPIAVETGTGGKR